MTPTKGGCGLPDHVGSVGKEGTACCTTCEELARRKGGFAMDDEHKEQPTVYCNCDDRSQIRRAGQEWSNLCVYCGREIKPTAPASQLVAPQIGREFMVKIKMHTDDAYMALDSPQLVRDAIGEALDKFKLQEEVDYTLEVSRVYEN